MHSAYRPTNYSPFVYSSGEAGPSSYHSTPPGWQSSQSSWTSSSMATPHSPPSSNNTSPSSIRQYESYPDNQNHYGSSSGSEWYPYEAEAHQDMFFEPTRDGSRIVKRGKTPYGFPCDAMEQERLNRQHDMMKLFLGRNYYGPLPDVLNAPPCFEGEPKRILDLGTGTGIWAMEIAEQFPSTEVVGIDMVPIQSRMVPPNCSFQIADLNDGLPFGVGSFDVVHLRFAQSGLVSPAHLFTEISRILRPGGIFLYLDSPPFSLCTSSSSSSFRPGIRGFRDAYDRAAWSRGDRSVVRDGGKAFRSMMDCASGLRIIGGGEMKIPLSGWSGSDLHSRAVGELALANMREMVEAGKVSLRQAGGYSEAQISSLERAFLIDVQRYQFSQSLYAYYAVKSR